MTDAEETPGPKAPSGARWGWALVLVVAVGGYWLATRRSPPAEDGRSRAIKGAIMVARSGDYGKAVTALEALRSDYPQDPEVLLNLGIAYVAAGQLEKADQSFAALLAVSPKDYDAQAERAGIRARMGQYGEAFDMLEQIPAGEGRMARRLAHDPIWQRVHHHPRMQALRDKHGRLEHSLRPAQKGVRRFTPADAKGASKPEAPAKTGPDVAPAP